jgi:hypothetical protein
LRRAGVLAASSSEAAATSRFVTATTSMTLALGFGFGTTPDGDEKQSLNKLLVNVVSRSTDVVIYNVLNCRHPLTLSAFFVKFEAILIAARIFAKEELDHAAVVEMNVWKINNSM